MANKPIDSVAELKKQVEALKIKHVHIGQVMSESEMISHAQNQGLTFASRLIDSFEANACEVARRTCNSCKLLWPILDGERPMTRQDCKKCVDKRLEAVKTRGRK